MTCSEPSFAEIIDSVSRQELAGSVVSAIEDRYGYDVVTENDAIVPHPFRLVHIIYQTIGFLAGDGLDGLLELPCRTTFSTYLAELGFKEVGAKLRRYVRWNRLFSYTRTRAVEQLLYRHNDRIVNAMGQYIVDNAGKFEPLLPHIRETLEYLKRFDPVGYEKKMSEPDPRTVWLQTLSEGLKSGAITIEDILED